MKEIATDVLIETEYEGVTLGIIRTPVGMIMVDAPKKSKDAIAWRAACSRASSGSDRLLVLLDEHPDRVCGANAIRCPIITHEWTALALSNRIPAARQPASQNEDFDESEPEPVNSRQTLPEITFSQTMTVHWGDEPILLEYHPGPSRGSTWVILPERQVVFLGDTVTPGQPPFLSAAHIEDWLTALHALKLNRFKDYLMISGRATLATIDDIRDTERLLKDIEKQLARLTPVKGKVDEIDAAAEDLMQNFNPKNKRDAEFFKNRLVYGLSQYLINHQDNPTLQASRD